MLKIKFETLLDVVFNVLKKYSTESKAKILSRVICESSLDGVQSHGVNRVPLLVKYIEEGIINTEAEAKVIKDESLFAQIDGCGGFGVLNALQATDKAIEIATDNGMGIVTLKNTNHWLRAGTYGWRAAEKGIILICWTNTIPNLPPYGANANLIGNNPFVIAIPRKKGHIVLDMAMSQFSYGKVASYARQKKELPVIGGYDGDGILTNNAKKIREEGHHLPIGFWKGSSFSFVLDMLAAILAGGKSSKDIGDSGKFDMLNSQLFIAINPSKFSDETYLNRITDETIEMFNQYNNQNDGSVRYPGQATLERRNENRTNGIPVEKEIWDKIKALA